MKKYLVIFTVLNHTPKRTFDRLHKTFDASDDVVASVIAKKVLAQKQKTAGSTTTVEIDRLYQVVEIEL